MDDNIIYTMNNALYYDLFDYRLIKGLRLKVSILKITNIVT